MFGWKILEGQYDINIKAVKLNRLEQEFLSKVLLAIRESHIENLNKALSSIIDEVALRERILLKQDQKQKYIDIINKFYFGLGYLEDIFSLDIEEIAIIGVNKPIYVYNKNWKSVNLAIDNHEYLVDLINKIAYSSGRKINLKNPRMNANLDNMRIHATIPPISDGEITIRLFRRTPLTIKDFIDVYSLEILAWLSIVMQADFNIVIAGNTGSGKTSFLNALFHFVPLKERIIIIEDTPEINIPHIQQVKLIENLELGISLRDLIYDTLRMRSDRTIMGEIRKPEEVKAFIDVLLSGQARGSYTTFHANSSDELVNRMIGYGVRQDDIKFIDFVIIQKRILTYKDSTLKEIRKGIEIKHLPSNTLIYKYSSKPYFNEQAIVSILSEKLWMSEQEIKELYKNRLEIISQTMDNFQEYQRRAYGLL